MKKQEVSGNHVINKINDIQRELSRLSSRTKTNPLPIPDEMEADMADTNDNEMVLIEIEMTPLRQQILI